MLFRSISIGQSVFLQAMAMKKPVVVTAVNGSVDYIQHLETGMLVPPRDAAALREAVRTLAADPALRDRLASAAFEQVQRHHMVKHYLQGVSDVLVQRFAPVSARGGEV